MTSALIYVLVLLVVAVLVFVGASVLFGRGEELAPIQPGASPTWLPEDEVRALDVRAVRFQQAVRGYRMAEVDWTLDRVAGELERLTDLCEGLRRRLAELEGHPEDGASEDGASEPEQREPEQREPEQREPEQREPEQPEQQETEA